MLARRFRILDEIGRGAFGTVYSAEVVAPYPGLRIRDQVAVKAVSMSRISGAEEREKLESEIAVMKSLDHKNIVKLYGIERTHSHYYLIMEQCNGGDLMSYIQSLKSYPDESLTRNYAMQIASGLSYLHCHDIVHRDLKPQNILISTTNSEITLKIADFGFARFLKPADFTSTICGSPMYMAPEIQFGQKYSTNVDIWSAGVILYELVSLRIPFPSVRTQYELASELRSRGPRPYTLPADAKASPEMRDLIQGMLTIDPLKRINFEEFIRHPFFRGQLGPLAEKTKRIQRFSFLTWFPDITGRFAERYLQEAKESAAVIASHFSACQALGSGVLFELQTMLVEFLVDFLNEERQVNDRYPSIEGQIIEMAKGFSDAAEGISHGVVEKGNAKKFLYQMGLEYAKQGCRAEMEGKSGTAKMNFQKALNMLYPITFSLNGNDNVEQVRDLYNDISTRDNLLTGSSEFDFGA